MTGEIIIYIKDVYGKPLAYPMNREGKQIAAIAHTKTLTRYSLRCCLEMGCTIIRVDARGKPVEAWTNPSQTLPAVAD